MAPMLRECCRSTRVVGPRLLRRKPSQMGLRSQGLRVPLCSPRQAIRIHPLVVSHFLDQGMSKEFGWQGTRDFSAWLSVPRAIEYMAEIGWESIMNA